MLHALLMVPLAFIYSAILEWVIHKYILHGLGKNKESFWSFHWHSHHKTCRKNKNFDENYKFPAGTPVKKEMASLILLAALHFPLWFASKTFYLTLVFCAARYFYLHRKCHTDIEWGKKKLPWHYDHHMGKEQDINWGVTTDLLDLIMKTRTYYLPRVKKDEK